MNSTHKELNPSDAAKLLQQIMGFKHTSKFRPITEAIIETDAIEKAKDKRNGGGNSLNAAQGETSEPFVRIGQKMELARAIYGERARADQAIKRKEEEEKEAERKALALKLAKRKRFLQK